MCQADTLHVPDSRAVAGRAALRDAEGEGGLVPDRAFSPTALTEESAPRRRGSGRSPQELEEAEEDPPPDPPEAAALLALRPESRFWSPGLREDKESPNLWQFATAAPGSKCILGERSALRNM